ncbi:MAG: hypothetical protein NVS4B8_22980 [Herpetosiphon sp.]
MAMLPALDQRIIGRYKLDHLLGSGGMGAVYLAEDVRLQRTVAIKICSTRSLPDDEAQAAADLFQHEALTLAGLRHPGLTPIWDYFNQDEDWYLVMEYVPGMTLRQVLSTSGGRLPREQVASYATQLCDVLGYLHARTPPLVFRDLKPSNIMVTPDGTLKLIDFGIARLFSPDKPADTAQFGTPGYSPPEQYGGQTEPRSDIYSLGVVVLQMLTGHHPHASAFVIPPARAVDPTVDSAIETVLCRATAPNPGDRFPTVADFCVALHRAFNGESLASPSPAQVLPLTASGATTIAPSVAAASTPSPPKRVAQPSSAGLPPPLRRGIVLLLVMLLVASLSGAGWLLRGWGADLFNTLRGGTPHPVAPLTIPGMLVYTAPGAHGDDLWLKQGANPPRTLTAVASGTNAALPALSPDRRQLAYTLDTAGGTQLWLIDDLTTGHSRRLLPQRKEARAASWSPDSKQLAVEVADATSVADHDIIILDLATGTTTDVISTPAWEGGPAWSPDGVHIAYQARYDHCLGLFLIDIKTKKTERLTQVPQNGSCETADPDGDVWPSWSPDGTRLAFGHKDQGLSRLAILDFRDRSIRVFKTGTATPARPEQPASHPRWSPDGTAIIFDEGVRKETMALSRLDLRTNEISTLPLSAGAHLSDWR